MTGAARFGALAARVRQVGLLAVAVGAITGLGVAAFDRLVQDQMFDRVLDLPLWVQALAPTVGLTAAALILRTWHVAPALRTSH